VIVNIDSNNYDSDIEVVWIVSVVVGMHLGWNVCTRRGQMSTFRLRHFPFCARRHTLHCRLHERRMFCCSLLVVEANRVYLQPIRGIEGSDYINASFIDVS